MKKLATFVVASFVAVAGVAGFSTPSLAGGDASLTIEKSVSGPVPDGTTFTIDLDCGTVPNEGTTSVTFDSQGNPVPAGSNVFTWGPVLGPGFDCAPTEQAIDGATVSYACSDSSQAITCDEAGPQAEPIVVRVVGTGSATVTVSNAFIDPPEPATTTTRGVAATGVSPTFTG